MPSEMIIDLLAGNNTILNGVEYSVDDIQRQQNSVIVSVFKLHKTSKDNRRVILVSSSETAASLIEPYLLDNATLPCLKGSIMCDGTFLFEEGGKESFDIKWSCLSSEVYAQ